MNDWEIELKPYELNEMDNDLFTDLEFFILLDIKGTRIKASCTKGPKKGSCSNCGIFSVRPTQFSKCPKGDTLNVHKSRMYKNQDIHKVV